VRSIIATAGVITARHRSVYSTQQWMSHFNLCWIDNWISAFDTCNMSLRLADPSSRGHLPIERVSNWVRSRKPRPALGCRALKKKQINYRPVFQFLRTHWYIYIYIFRMKHQFPKQVTSSYCELISGIGKLVPFILHGFQTQWLDLTMYREYSHRPFDYKLTILKYRFSSLINKAN